MEKSSEITHGRHCVFNFHVHLVFVAKYRKNIFRSHHIDALKEIWTKVCADFEAALVEIDGERNHVHLLIHYQPKTPVSKLVNSLKGVSARLLKKQFPDLSKCYYKNALWSPSYFAASCGGAPISIIRKYIENQETPD
jgi:putative transposase